MSVGVQPVETWHEANQRSLMAAIARVKDILDRHVNAEITPWPGDTDHSPNGSEPAASALDRLCTIFGVSPFERDILLLCAGIELDASCCTTLCARLRAIPHAPIPPSAWHWRYCRAPTGAPSLRKRRFATGV